MNKIKKIISDKNNIRRSFLIAGICSTVFGCIIAAIGIALPAWQVVELSEFNAIHEHGIFSDCVRSEIVSLEQIRKKTVTSTPKNNIKHLSSYNFKINKKHNNNNNKINSITNIYNNENYLTTKKCFSKFKNIGHSSTWTMHMAIEEGDPSAREMLFHRFLPQHKAIIFFFVFSVIFALISIAVGSCSECFVPNGVLHVISVGMSMCCSILGDVIFFLASTRLNNQNIHGAIHIYYQNLSYGFYLHVFGSVALIIATICAAVGAYFLIRQKCNIKYCFKKQKLSKRFPTYQYNKYCNGNTNSTNTLNLISTNVPSESLYPIDKQNVMLIHSMNFYGSSSHLENDCNLRSKDFTTIQKQKLSLSETSLKNNCDNNINTNLLQLQPLTSTFIKNQPNTSAQSSISMQYNQNSTAAQINNSFSKTNLIMLEPKNGIANECHHKNQNQLFNQAKLSSNDQKIGVISYSKIYKEETI